MIYSRIGKGKELLFLHGWGCDKSIFAHADGLSNYTVTRVDFAGFGDSPEPTNAVNLDYYVAEVETLLDSLQMVDVTVIGHSFGGRVAIKLANNSRIKNVILVDSAGLKPKRRLDYYVKVATYKLLKMIDIKLNAGSSDYKKLSKVMKGTFINVVNEDLTPFVKNIEKPVLLIWGEKDKETPMYMLRKMEKLINKHKTVLFEECGHYPFIEQQTRFYSLVQLWANQ